MNPADIIAVAGVLALFVVALLGALGTLILKAGSQGAKLDDLIAKMDGHVQTTKEQSDKLEALVIASTKLADKLELTVQDLRDTDESLLEQIRELKQLRIVN